MSAEIRNAATIVLVDQSDGEPKLFMGRRHRTLAFMPGLYVFPGGKVEPTDRRIRVAAPFAAHVEQRLASKTAHFSRRTASSLGVAAVRELAEETGLLIGSRTSSERPPRGENWRDFAAVGVTPTIDGLWFIARAITPKGFVRRYDTRFFVADAQQVVARSAVYPCHDGELADLRWVSIAEAISLDIATITRSVLRLLPARLEAGLGHDMPVPFFNGNDQVPVEML